MVNRAGRKPPNSLFIFPGGIAEVFASSPGTNTIVMKKHKGLMKLSLETGAMLTPCYVFGGTDFFNNLVVGDSLLSQLSRKLRMGVTLFFGQYGLPIPFRTRVTMCIGKPIPIEKWKGEGKIPDELISNLHNKVGIRN